MVIRRAREDPIGGAVNRRARLGRARVEAVERGGKSVDPVDPSSGGWFREQVAAPEDDEPELDRRAAGRGQGLARHPLHRCPATEHTPHHATLRPPTGPGPLRPVATPPAGGAPQSLLRGGNARYGAIVERPESRPNRPKVRFHSGSSQTERDSEDRPRPGIAKSRGGLSRISLRRSETPGADVYPGARRCSVA